MRDEAAHLDGSPRDAAVDSFLRSALLEALNGHLRDSLPSGAAATLRPVRDAVRSRKLDVALRLLDRAWRCDPEDAAILAPLYGHLLLLEARDPDAALHLLRRGQASSPNPDGAALIVLALLRAGRPADARADLASALAAYAVVPGGLLFQVAGTVMRQLADAPGWMGRGPDLAVVGELLGDTRPRVLEFAFEGQPVLTQLLPPPRKGSHAFKVTSPQADVHACLDVRVRGVPLLGGSARFPADFALDGRIDSQGRRLTGWVRLGWAPARTVQLRVEDEHGGRAVIKTRGVDRGSGGRRVDFELKAHDLRGNRLELTARLPDGRWAALPDSPLLLGPGLRAPRGKAPRLLPWGTETPRRERAVEPVPARNVDIVIPVYRDREATLACIAAVLATVDASTPVVVVDDATEDSVLATALDGLAADARITLLRHATNQGFVVSANRGLALHPTHDAVLLNADTCVFGDWLVRLRAAAYSGGRVGTVTPLSNCGSIASYPREGGPDILADEAGALQALAAATHPGVRVTIPVGVGFCLYVRRDCLTEVGPLDAAVFGKGYGEETDFCLRARGRGWSHQLAADVFVYHAGGLSFGGRRAALLDRSQRLINLRHPGYDRFIASFLAKDPLLQVRRRLDERRLSAFDGRFVLLVTLALSGGVERFVTERCRALRAQALFPLVLKAAAAGDTGRCTLTTEALDVPNLTYEIPAELGDLSGLLGSLDLASVEIQHFLHLDARVIEAVRALPLPYDVFVHDYAWICPRITLIDGSGRYCGEPAVAVCENCVRRHGSHLGDALSVAQLRARSASWLRGARRVIAPSADTAARLRRHFEDLPVAVLPLSPPLPARPPLRRTEKRKAVRIALLGAIGEHKGYEVLLECARQARALRLPLEFVVIGYTENDAPLLATGKVFVTGRYGEAEVPHLLHREQPDAIWLPSVWPETWSYTLDHALAAGMPVVAFDLGAIAERLRAAGRGELLPLTSDAAQINRRLLRLADACELSEATASRSEHLPLAGPPLDATMLLTMSAEPAMTNPVGKTAEQTAEGLSASVQVLPLASGLYLFSVKAAALGKAAVGGQLQLPAMHVGLGPGVRSEDVEFMGGPATQGGWLFAAGDLLVVKVAGTGATLILTSVRAPTGDVLSIKVERLGAAGEAPAAAATANLAPPPETADDGTVPMNILAHIRTRGDMNFSKIPWAGRVAPGLWIESFSVRPLERFAAGDLEYKGLTGSGFETPWLSDDQPCGTQGMAVPLVGFALRFKPSPATGGFDCEYSGYFQSGVTVGPLRNGAPCRSTVANDPLEGLQVRLVKRDDSPSNAKKLPATVAPVAGHPGKRPVPAAALPRGSARATPRPAHRGS
jgi:GT2 family glycosyltransferase/glycosyltransferase involved in cell wall biosynthesis